ncbi:hypothetical protein OIU78_024300 [Salix suchowensis]|nr:hypothetical protein OIU78_024300 [Salix suchowensis]
MTRKRGRPAGGSTRKGKIGAGQARRTRARIVNKPAKISGEKSDESCSHDDKNEENDTSEGNDEIHGGKPAGGITKKGKMGAGLARRTRARIINKPAKISEEKSDESCSHDDKIEENDTSEGNDENHGGRPPGGSTKKGNIGAGQARRTRIANKPAKILEETPEESCSQDDKIEENEMSEGNEEIHEPVSNYNLDNQQTKTVEDSESSLRGKAKEETAEDNRHEEWLEKAPDVEMGQRYYGQATEKLEVMVDPVHAILMDMIPSLGMKKLETTNPTFEGPNAQPSLSMKKVEDTSPILDTEKPAEDPSLLPVKKKVSYKDLAAKLLMN